MQKQLCSTVSIPQGTIKSRERFAVPMIITPFQFHKVRLKDNSAIGNSWFYRVSIPQGTIKSRSNKGATDRADTVSIPQGTIKSNELGRGTASVTVFQFHKVRLKVYHVAKMAGVKFSFNSTRYD